MTRIARRILKLQGITQGFLSLAFVTDQKIKTLNRKYLKKNYATDVLAFDLKDEGKRRPKKRIEGEIVVSAATAFKNAKLYGTTPQKELVLYVIHGILHLCGYDDHSARDTLKMRKKEQQLLSRLNISR